MYVIPVAGLRKVMPTKEHWAQYFLQAAVGEDIDVEKWLQKLVEMGYARNSNGDNAR